MVQSGLARGPVKAEIAGSNPVGTAKAYPDPRLERWPSPVEGDGLENRYRGNPIVGSNPTLSASPFWNPRSGVLKAGSKEGPRRWQGGWRKPGNRCVFRKPLYPPRTESTPASSGGRRPASGSPAGAAQVWLWGPPRYAIRATAELGGAARSPGHARQGLSSDDSLVIARTLRAAARQLRAWAGQCWPGGSPRPGISRLAGVTQMFRGAIADGDALDMEVHRYRIIYNTIRPHQALGDRTPGTAYTGCQQQRTA